MLYPARVVLLSLISVALAVPAHGLIIIERKPRDFAVIARVGEQVVSQYAETSGPAHKIPPWPSKSADSTPVSPIFLSHAEL